jgi:hypothetical protein
MEVPFQGLVMMMILYHMRHERQDNHATNHVRCTKPQGRAKQKAYRGQTKQNHILLKLVDYNAYPAKQWKSIMSILMGETQLLCTGARESGCKQTRKDDEGQLHPSPLLGLADRAWQNHARQTRRRWKLWTCDDDDFTPDATWKAG